jgi:putative chitinase
MDFDFTVDQLKQCSPANKTPDNLFQALNDILPNYNITSVNRVAGFLAQCGHESSDFTRLTENLNYGAPGLVATFPKYFPTLESAQPYARQPEKIANHVYANRFGNGPEESGDGFRYRGRGAIQLTFHDNYQAFANAIGKSLPDTVAYCETLEGAIESACFYWKNRNINPFADAKDIQGMTKLINAKLLGLDDRTARFEKALAVLGGQAAGTGG